MVPAEPALRFSDNPFPIGGGRLGALIRTYPWSRTPLGAVLRWPQSLKTAIDMVVQSPVPMCLFWGADGIAIYNDAYAGILGDRHPATLGKSIFETWPEVADFHRRVVKAGFAGRATSFRDQQFALVRDGGAEDAWLNLDCSPIRNEAGLPAGVLAIVSDTTRQVLAARAQRAGERDGVEGDVTAETQALQAVEDQLRQSQKMEAVGQLTGGIAHDFNNLLTGIIGGLDLVKRRLASGRTGDVDRFIDAAVASANRAAGLTNRLLAFSRRQALDLKPLDLRHLIESLEELFRRTLSERIDVQIATPNDLWVAEGDASQIETALINLAVNARDAMPHGGTLALEAANVTVAAGDVMRDVAPGDYIVMRVRDTGVGMSPDIRKRAFDPFFTTKPMGQGTGLGLSMVYGYAKQARGHVQIDSAEGAGTVVSLYLPRYRGPAQMVSVSGSGAQSPAEETVLVIEDDTAVRLMVVEVLHELGYTTIEASDDKAAIPVLESGRHIDLLVTDVGLPGLNGRQIADFARLQRKNLRVLFITGYAEDAAMRDGFLEPGMEILAKPFSIDALTGRLRRMTSVSQQPAPTRH